ncbi:hypothetical protein G6011_10030 [Neofusicoccum parvum]|uniref:Uncharacterized protein n=1 Tax=Neofusicoccum parvum TaxID=310453 RepID=A0ACB5SPT6_9PEZI|nr:hypothetical protein G6011_10030 [Neofusicoccum parvum]
MHDGRSSAKGSVPTPKPIKYRLACDRCQRSKIRCDQERPACRRCTHKGMECVYSPARRAGRPRTRNDANSNKSSFSAESSQSASQTRRPTPAGEHCINIPATRWGPPLSPPGTTGSTSDDCTSSNAAIIPGLAPPIQLLSPDDMRFSHDPQPDDYFLHGLLDLTDSDGSGPTQTADCDYDMFSDFDLSPDLLAPTFSSAPAPAPWEPAQPPSPHAQHHQSPHQPAHHLATIPPAPITTPDNCTPSPSPTPSAHPCHCTTTLLAHLSPAPSPPPTALLASKALLARCRAALACPNACRTRASTALLVCSCVDRALSPLMGDASLWASPTGSDKGVLCGEDDGAPLRCGGLAIGGAERRAAVRTLVVRRMVEGLEVLGGLRGALVEGGGGGGCAWALCADLVGEFAGKVAERVEAVRAQM